MNIRQRGSNGCMAVKLDISKTYNKLEWSFLKDMMWKLGFNEGWISRIMTCVTTISYSVLIKGQSSSVIKPMEVFTKDIQFFFIFTSFVQRILAPYLIQLKILIRSEVSMWLEIVLLLTISSL